MTYINRLMHSIFMFLCACYSLIKKEFEDKSIIGILSASSIIKEENDELIINSEVDLE